MAAIFLFPAFGGCCPSWATIRGTVNPLLSKEREAPNPQTLGCARDALRGVRGTPPALRDAAIFLCGVRSAQSLGLRDASPGHPSLVNG